MTEITKECLMCNNEYTIKQETLDKITAKLNREPSDICAKCFYKIDKKKIKEHSRGARLKELYGITNLEYNKMLYEQGGVCKICGGKQTKYGKPAVLHVDHDHATGKVRGLLCSRCNVMLGCAKDKISTLINAISYLK